MSTSGRNRRHWPALLLAALVLPGRLALAQSEFASPDWGGSFVTCQGEKAPLRLRTSLESDVTAHGILTCRDAGDAYLYNVEYMNFGLGRYTTWKSAHVDWIGSAAQRAGAGGRNDWSFDDAKPIR